MKHQKYHYSYVIIAMLLLASLACNFSLGGGEPSLNAVTTCASVTDGQECVGEKSEFEATETVYASVAVENLSSEDTVTARWINGEIELFKVDFPVESDLTGYISFNLTPEENLLPPGDYTTEIYYNNEIVQTANFAVTGAAPEEMLQGITFCHTIDANQACQDPTDVFAPIDRVNASIKLSGVPIGTKFDFRWLRGDEVIAEVSQTMESAGAGYLSSNLTPDKPFPPGEYQFAVNINDTPVEQVSFQVEGEYALELGSISTCYEIDADNRCVDQTNTFAPEDIFFASIEIVSGPSDSVIGGRWLYDEELIQEISIPFEDGGSGYAYIEFTPDGSFTSGEYTVEVYAEDTFANAIAYQIAGDTNNETASDSLGSAPADDAAWQTLDSDDWQLVMDYPTAWQIDDTDNYIAFMGEGKTQFYLTGTYSEDAPDEATLAAAQGAVDLYLEAFPDIEATELTPFPVGGVEGLTTDYLYTDQDGDLIAGSILVGTSEQGNTYTVYIEALADDYETALGDFNVMLETLQFK